MDWAALTEHTLWPWVSSSRHFKASPEPSSTCTSYSVSVILHIPLWVLTAGRLQVEFQKGNPQSPAMNFKSKNILFHNILLCYRTLIFPKWIPDMALVGQKSWNLTSGALISELCSSWPSNFPSIASRQHFTTPNKPWNTIMEHTVTGIWTTRYL